MRSSSGGRGAGGVNKGEGPSYLPTTAAVVSTVSVRQQKNRNLQKWCRIFVVRLFSARHRLVVGTGGLDSSSDQSVVAVFVQANRCRVAEERRSRGRADSFSFFFPRPIIVPFSPFFCDQSRCFVLGRGGTRRAYVYRCGMSSRRD